MHLHLQLCYVSVQPHHPRTQLGAPQVHGQPGLHVRKGQHSCCLLRSHVSASSKLEVPIVAGIFWYFKILFEILFRLSAATLEVWDWLEDLPQKSASWMGS